MKQYIYIGLKRKAFTICLIQYFGQYCNKTFVFFVNIFAYSLNFIFFQQRKFL